MMELCVTQSEATVGFQLGIRYFLFPEPSGNKHGQNYRNRCDGNGDVLHHRTLMVTHPHFHGWGVKVSTCSGGPPKYMITTRSLPEGHQLIQSLPMFSTEQLHLLEMREIHLGGV
jgi:hypothetical protein